MSQPSAPKTLLLSRSVPPAPAGTAVIVGNLIKQFERSEMIVLGAKTVGAPVANWQANWPAVKHVTLMPPHSWPGVRWIRWAQWPWLVLCTLWMLLISRCSVILVVYPDDVYLLAAYVASLVTGRPLLPYLHNVYLELDSSSRLARWLEPRVFARARCVLVMSEAMQRFYKPIYPHLTVKPLVHSFNEPLPDSIEVSAVHEPLRLSLSGNINNTNRDAAGRLAEVVRTLPDVHLTLYSGTPEKHLVRAGFFGNRITIKTVSRDVLLSELAAADVLLLPHGFSGSVSDDEIYTIFPTRTIEYLIVGRPILAHLPAGCFLAEFLQRYDCALLVTEPSAAAVEGAIERLRTDEQLRQELVNKALLAARQFQAPIVADQLRDVFTTFYR